MDTSTKLLSLFFAGTVLAQAGNVYPIGNMFDPKATPAESAFNISILMLAICAAIFVVVGGLLLFAVIRFRRREDSPAAEPLQFYGSSRIELAWIVIPVLIVLVLGMSTARAVIEVQNRQMPPNALQVSVVGHQWWWEYRYPSLGIVTANELHVPVNASTVLKLESADVAHSFWIPQLAGKTDLIPGVTNTMWIDPRQTGIFLGNCAEYCGTQHANMLLRVFVDEPEDFAKWAAAQKAPAASSPAVKAERDTFLSISCINCHTVSGTIAKGTAGPDLSHLMSRSTLGSGLIPNTLENLRAWVKDPQQIKRGNLMPNMQLNARELNAVVTYLGTLK